MGQSDETGSNFNLRNKCSIVYRKHLDGLLPDKCEMGPVSTPPPQHPAPLAEPLPAPVQPAKWFIPTPGLFWSTTSTSASKRPIELPNPCLLSQMVKLPSQPRFTMKLAMKLRSQQFHAPGRPLLFLWRCPENRPPPRRSDRLTIQKFFSKAALSIYPIHPNSIILYLQYMFKKMKSCHVRKCLHIKPTHNILNTYLMLKTLRVRRMVPTCHGHAPPDRVLRNTAPAVAIQGGRCNSRKVRIYPFVMTNTLLMKMAYL